MKTQITATSSLILRVHTVIQKLQILHVKKLWTNIAADQAGNVVRNHLVCDVMRLTENIEQR